MMAVVSGRSAATKGRRLLISRLSHLRTCTPFLARSARFSLVGWYRLWTINTLSRWKARRLLACGSFGLAYGISQTPRRSLAEIGLHKAGKVFALCTA